MEFWTRLPLFERCLTVSVLIHVALLGVRLVDPDGFDKMFKDAGMEVILVNAQSDQAPDKARAIAQFSLKGGGELDKGRATSPLQADVSDVIGNAEKDNAQIMDGLRAHQDQMLAQLREQLAMQRALLSAAQLSSDSRAEVQKIRQRIKQFAEIERQVVQENERPRKRFVSPSTISKVHAAYYQAFKQRVEELGTQNFPQVGGKKLYGELTMSISIDRTGSVMEARVMESTGNPNLDKMAAAIVEAGAPYGKFSEAMVKEFQVLVIVTRFKFTKDNTLDTVMVPGQ